MSVFGDPHIVAFGAGRGEYQTCSAPGDTNYLTNRYIKVMGENTVAVEGEDGTFLTAVSTDFVEESPLNCKMKTMIH